MFQGKGKTLIITEKPSVAREYASILKVNGPRKEGVIENDEYCITWCVGHLVEMLYPDAYDPSYKKWSLEALPFLPREYKYDVISNVKRQYEIVNHALHREDIDTVLWAGDSGKEGQVIEENIRRFGGVREGMKELRVWIDSCTEEEILRGIREAKPMSEYDNLANSGIMRSIEDYAVGINFSRALSVRYGNMLNQAAGTKSYTAIAIGRVMTCVLGLVVKREREIRNFEETFFYKVRGLFGNENILCEWKLTDDSGMAGSPKLYKDNGFLTREAAEEFIHTLEGKEARIASLTRGDKSQRAPLLFNLAELQAECAKRFKISPDQTLSVAQNLYEKKLTTYPRTDARVLSTAIAKEVGKNLYGLKKYEPVLKFTETILQNGYHKKIANSQYTDDKKVTDHYAIIPTGNLSEYQSLSDLEKNVYDMIVRRFLCIFYPAAVFERMALEVVIEKEHFFAAAKRLKTPGYLEILGRDSEPAGENSYKDGQKEKDEENQNRTGLEKLFGHKKQNDEISVNDFDLKEGKTQPPKRYTSGSMVLAMENAGQFIEEEELRAQIKGSGIGTSATRAEIIAKLVKIGYLHLNRKSQILSPEKFGEMVYDIVDMTIPALLEPKMTASWEKGLDGITNGTVELEDYRSKLEAYIAKETNRMKQIDYTEQIADKIELYADNQFHVIVDKHEIGVKCPLCGGEVETTPFGFGCKNYSKDGTGCRFSIGKIAGKRLSEAMVVQLLTEGKTPVLDGFTSKTGVSFKAALRLKEENGVKAIAFDFQDVKPDYLEDLSCPVCQGRIMKTAYGFACENKKRDSAEGCYFQIGKIAKRDVTEEDLRELINQGQTQLLKGFVSQKGKKFDAALQLVKNEERWAIQFLFPDSDPVEVPDLFCPDCGGKMFETFYGYACEKFLAQPKECEFSIGTIASKKLNLKEATDLINNGKTEPVSGLKSKSGKRFQAILKLKKNESGHSEIVFDFDEIQPEQLKNVVCPDCGGTIQVTAFGYGCSNYKADKTGCNFVIGKIAGKSLSAKDVTTLLKGERTEPIKGLKAKDGKRFQARLRLVKDETGHSQVQFDFDDIEPECLEDVVCPDCGGKMLITPNGFGCGNYQKDGSGCRFFVGKIAGKMLTKAEVTLLLKERKTDVINGFVSSKTKKKFAAGLQLRKKEDGKSEIVFDFENEMIGVLAGVNCPVCGGFIAKTPFGYGCKNYKKDGSGCNFSIGTVGGKKLTESVVKKLLTDGKSDIIEGFRAKSGKSFAAALKLEEVKEENGKLNKRIVFDFPKPEETEFLCPVCQRKLLKNEWSYGCQCGFRMNRQVASLELPKETVQQLLTESKSDILEGFRSKNGDLFAASLKRDENGNLTFDFEQEKTTEKDIGPMNFEPSESDKKMMDEAVNYYDNTRKEDKP